MTGEEIARAVLELATLVESWESSGRRARNDTTGISDRTGGWARHNRRPQKIDGTIRSSDFPPGT